MSGRIGILICDDEWMVRDGVKKVADSYDQITTYTADSGTTALALMREHKDIAGVILDIRMPDMDGLCLLQKLREEKFDPEVVILSGHDEFDYAAQSMKYGVLEYVLKPVTSEKIRQIMDGLLRGIERKEELSARLSSYQAQIDTIRPVIRERYIIDLLNDSLTAEQRGNVERFLGIDLSYGPFCCVMMRVKSASECNDENLMLRLYAIREVLEHEAERCVDVFLFCISSDTFAFVTRGDQAIKAVTKLFDDTLIRIAEDYMVLFTAGWGRQVEEVEQLRSSYNEACTALNCNEFVSQVSVISIDDIMEHDFEEYDALELLSELRLLGDAAAIARLSDVVERIRQDSRVDLDTAVLICETAVSAALARLKKTKEGYDEFSRIFRKNPLSVIASAADLSLLCVYTLGVISDVGAAIGSGESKKIKKLVENCRGMIDERFTEDIGVTELSEALCVSKNYLGQIFKRETGLTINEYLTQARLMWAKKLLSGTNLKIYEIAYRCGYSDCFYFSNIFKKHIGVSPSEYRDS